MKTNILEKTLSLKRERCGNQVTKANMLLEKF